MENVYKQMANPLIITTSPFMCLYIAQYENQPSPHNEFAEITAHLGDIQLGDIRGCICKHH